MNEQDNKTCNCNEIDCVVETLPPYDFLPTEEEKEEIEANFLDDAGVGRM
jgi:hypothetical protein